MLKLYNYLSRKIESFEPLNPSKVGFYTCGPTTYDFAHIGNFRTYIFEDVLQRVLETEGYEVKRVMNITDIDDKIIKGAKERGLPIDEFSAPFEHAFMQDLAKLNIKYANVFPKATEHIGHMIKYIEELINKGLAYAEIDGSVYFDISKFSDYGRLSQVDKRELKSGTRVLSDEYTKDNVSDFALWKSVRSDEVGYDSPWGRGRPGWHIECSVMSQEYLGQTFDIHAGGVDLIFPHHENEIAQSEGKTTHKFVNFFVEGEHLLVQDQKMAKSAGNFYKLNDLEEKDFDLLAFRYLCLTAHYRDKLNFTWQSLQSAQNALNNLRETIREWDSPNIGCAGFEQDFKEAINNDLGMPQALAILWDLVKSDYPTSAKAKTILEMDKVLGLRLDEYLGKKIEVPKEIMKLIHQREAARKGGDFKKSDKLRKVVKKLGFEIEDNPSGPKLKAVVDEGRSALDVAEEEIITIDGPTSSGKNSVGFLLAQKLGYKYIDSGMIYRAGCQKMLQENISIEDLEKILVIFRALDVKFETNNHWKMFLDGKDMTDSLHTPEISKLVPIVSAYPKVREIMRGIQRRLGADGKIVMGGRDIGSEIYPGAKHKFFLSASTEVRAQRRFQQLVQKNPSTKYEDVLKDMEKRDTQDMTREASPLRVPEDAVTIDNSNLTIEQTVDEMLKDINA